MNKNYSDKLVFLEDRWHWRSDDTDLKCFHGWKEENQLLNVLDKYLEKKNVMVQAGGNCGMQVDKFAKEFGMVYTFEPDPINFQCLVANLPYANVVKIQACVADTHKLLDVDFFVDDIGSIHVKNNKGKIPTFKIDDLALEECDLIQLDVEGFEYFAVMGAIETIKKFKPVLCLEFTWLQRYGVDPQIMLKLLTSLGYEMVENYTNDYIFKYKKLSFSL